MLNPSARSSKTKFPALRISPSLSVCCLLLTCSVGEFWDLLGTVRRPRQRRTAGIRMPEPAGQEHARGGWSSPASTRLPVLSLCLQ